MQIKSPYGGTATPTKSPVGDYDQANKKYVDDTVGVHANNLTLHVTPTQDTW